MSNNTQKDTCKLGLREIRPEKMDAKKEKKTVGETKLKHKKVI